MPKVKRMASGGITSIGGLIYDGNNGGGGNDATSGLRQVNSGADTIGSALKTAASAIGGGDTGGNFPGGPVIETLNNPLLSKKKGGSVKHAHASKISTAQKNNKHPNW
jgi:hypothetical protein